MDSDLGDERAQKFDMKNKEIMNVHLDSRKLVPGQTKKFYVSMDNLLLHSVTSSTWKRHNSAWNSYKNFCQLSGNSYALPISIEQCRAYVTWAITEKKLKPGTVENYISSLSTAHSLSGLHCDSFSKDRCIQLLLKGAENLILLGNPHTNVRLAMNIHLLRLLGHRIDDTSWDILSKQVVWTACTVSFYSSCRMGELLSTEKLHFDRRTTLKWDDVTFVEGNEAILYIPFTKTTGLKGTVINLFPIDNPTCPLAALKQLKSMCETDNLYEGKNPVFRFRNGTYLTVQTLNELLAKLLKEFNDKHNKISCHSFRAAIPSAIASCPDKGTVEEIKQWGTWRSESYRKYTRQERDKDRTLFYKAVNLL